jgi:hypothetical protein
VAAGAADCSFADTVDSILLLLHRANIHLRADSAELFMIVFSFQTIVSQRPASTELLPAYTQKARPPDAAFTRRQRLEPRPLTHPPKPMACLLKG